MSAVGRSPAGTAEACHAAGGEVVSLPAAADRGAIAAWGARPQTETARADR